MEYQGTASGDTLTQKLWALFQGPNLQIGFFTDDNNVAFLVSIWILAIMYSLLFFFSVLRYVY